MGKGDSKKEMDQWTNLAKLKSLKDKQETISFRALLEAVKKSAAEKLKKEEEEDEEAVKSFLLQKEKQKQKEKERSSTHRTNEGLLHYLSHQNHDEMSHERQGQTVSGVDNEKFVVKRTWNTKQEAETSSTTMNTNEMSPNRQKQEDITKQENMTSSIALLKQYGRDNEQTKTALALLEQYGSDEE